MRAAASAQRARACAWREHASSSRGLPGSRRAATAQAAAWRADPAAPRRAPAAVAEARGSRPEQPAQQVARAREPAGAASARRQQRTGHRGPGLAVRAAAEVLVHALLAAPRLQQHAVLLQAPLVVQACRARGSGHGGGAEPTWLPGSAHGAGLTGPAGSGSSVMGGTDGVGCGLRARPINARTAGGPGRAALHTPSQHANRLWQHAAHPPLRLNASLNATRWPCSRQSAQAAAVQLCAAACTPDSAHCSGYWAGTQRSPPAGSPLPRCPPALHRSQTAAPGASRCRGKVVERCGWVGSGWLPRRLTSRGGHLDCSALKQSTACQSSKQLTCFASWHTRGRYAAPGCLPLLPAAAAGRTAPPPPACLP